jgi:3-dehydroquinate synthetase
MKLKFSLPATLTNVKFFASEAAFLKSANRSNGLFIWDKGAPLPASDKKFRICSFAGGESSKSWSELGKALEMLVEQRHERSEPLFVTGGGAVMDLGAMAASLYRRGIPLVLVPTTLLGMVDAAVGGKTAVDSISPDGILKNFAGTFYPAQEVWIAPHFLASLPKAERLSGAGEAWKTLWIAGGSGRNQALFDFVQDGKLSSALVAIIRKCLDLKIRVVQSDPLDKLRRREVLNFGHTIGHVLESSGGISHGEAVLWGMAAETLLLGKSGEIMLAEILRIITGLSLTPPAAFFDLKNHRSLLLADKKAKDGKIELSLLSKPGKIVKLRCSTEQISGAIRVFPEFYRHASAHLRA